MNRLMRIAKWLWKAWPVIVLGLIIGAHWALRYAIPVSTPWIDKWTSALTQAIGGIIVIYSLVENLGLFGKGTPWTIFKSWLCEFPWATPKHTLAGVSGGAMSSLVGTLKAHGSQSNMTIEERLDAVEQRLNAVTLDLINKEKALSGKIELLRAETLKRFIDGEAAFAALADKLKQTAVGSFKPQLFGALLATYGIWLGAYMTP